MKESGLDWPLISDDEQNHQLQCNNAIVKFYASFNVEALKKSSAQQFIDEHSEKELLARVTARCREWLRGIPPEESDEYVLQDAAKVVECIAYVLMQILPHCPRKGNRLLSSFRTHGASLCNIFAADVAEVDRRLSKRSVG